MTETPVETPKPPDCTLCLEPMTPEEFQNGLITTTLCNHQFHTACLQHVTTNSCPLCRQALDPSQPITGSPYDPDNFAPPGFGVGGGAAIPTHGPQFHGVWVVPTGAPDYTTAIIQGATIDVSGGVGGGYIDVSGGAGYGVHGAGPFDFILADGTLAVQGAMIDRDDDPGAWIFTYPANGYQL